MIERRGIQLIALFSFALLLRLAIAFVPIVYAADELWQYLEPAYGLITGHWIETWEFREGIRSWLLPELLTLPMALGRAIAPDSQWHLIMPRVFLACLSLSIPAAFWSLGNRIGRSHGLVALFVGAFWVEIFYFAPRPLADSIACMLAFPAICAVYRLRESPARIEAVLAGCLIALCFVIRFQLAPALLLLTVCGLWRAPFPVWSSFLAGVALGLGVDAIANLAVGATPFVWIVLNLKANLVDGRAATFGTEPFFWYFIQIAQSWKAAMIFVIPGIILGSRRFPVVCGMALLVILSHSVIPHKELRFILFAQMAFIFLAAVGTTDMARWLARRLNEPLSYMVSGLLVLWLVMSASVGLSSPFLNNWYKVRAQFLSQVIAGRRPDLCGLGMISHSPVALSYAVLNRDVPVFLLENASDAVESEPQINTIIAPSNIGRSLPRTFERKNCVSRRETLQRRQYCIYVRMGKCSGNGGRLEYNHALILRGL